MQQVAERGIAACPPIDCGDRKLATITTVSDMALAATRDPTLTGEDPAGVLQ